MNRKKLLYMRIINSMKRNKIMITLSIVIIIISLLVIIFSTNKDDTFYEVTSGNYKIYTETNAYVVNNETVVEYDKDDVFIPIAESAKRITINNVIGIYKNEEYEKGISKLNEMDNEINTKLSKLPEVYSNEVVSIEREIEYLVKKTNTTTSYIEMNDNKTKLDRLVYEKALTVSSLTPSGNDVMKLILERDEYKNNLSKSSNNVKSPISGVVVYKNDGLENNFNISELKSIDNINNLINSYDNINNETFGIKIVDNYESYVIIKEDKSNDKYISENRIYTIELLDKNTSIKGLLISKIDDSKYNYCIFKINNNIEEIVDLRKTNVKVIWRQLRGFVVNNTSIKTIDTIDYVTKVSLNRYIDVPVKTLLKMDNISLVTNYTKEEKEELNIENNANINVYDRIVEIKEGM